LYKHFCTWSIFEWPSPWWLILRATDVSYTDVYNTIPRFTSSSTSQLISIIIHTLIIHHSFTLSLQAQNLPLKQILSTVYFFYLMDRLTITGLDRPITLIIFLVLHFNFLFVPCGRLSWLPVSFLLHVKHTTVSYLVVFLRDTLHAAYL